MATTAKKKAPAKKTMSDVEVMAMKETLAERKRERSGKADDLPEQAFLYVGDINEVRAKAKAM